MWSFACGHIVTLLDSFCMRVVNLRFNSLRYSSFGLLKSIYFFTPDWFYHAPSRKTSTAAKPAPPASQIPGIGGLKDECANPEQDDRHFRRKWIRDTDSKYIKLAKAGGRKNLLAFRSPPTKADEPVPYPRVDWFDHDPPEDEESNEFQCTVKQEKQHKKSNPG